MGGWSSRPSGKVLNSWSNMASLHPSKSTSITMGPAEQQDGMETGNSKFFISVKEGETRLVVRVDGILSIEKRKMARCVLKNYDRLLENWRYGYVYYILIYIYNTTFLGITKILVERLFLKLLKKKAQHLRLDLIERGFSKGHRKGTFRCSFAEKDPPIWKKQKTHI